MTIDHSRAARLLPWYINGSLNANEFQDVNAHLEICAECRAALASEVALATTFVDDGAMARRLIASPPSAPIPAQRPARPRLSMLAALAAAACAAIVVAAAVYVVRVPIAQSQFRLLTTESPESTPVLQVLFRKDAQAADVSRVLTATGGRVVSGPSALGVYRVALAPQADPQQVLRLIEQDPMVAMVAAERTPGTP